HDGDQNNAGGDTGEACVGIIPTCVKAADCNDQNPCTSESCVAGQCQYTQIPGCRLCSTAADCDDQNACTTDSCSGGVCQNTTMVGCTPCSTAADCDDQNACTIESCDAGVCHYSAIEACTPCSTARHCQRLHLRRHLQQQRAVRRHRHHLHLGYVQHPDLQRHGELHGDAAHRHELRRRQRLLLQRHLRRQRSVRRHGAHLHLRPVQHPD